MYRLKYFIAACIVAVSQLAVVATADAVSPSLVISQVMAGQSTGNGDANHEFVVLYNNTAAPVDITNWYITNKNNEFARFTAGDSSTHLMVPAWGSATVVSQAYAAAHPGVYDVTFVGANRLIASSDTVTVFTGTGSAIDIVAWGDLAAGSSLQRQEATAGVLKDTDAVDDFMVNLTPVVPASATYEEVVVIWRPLPEEEKKRPLFVRPPNIVYEIDGAPASKTYEDYLARDLNSLRKELKRISLFYPIGIHLKGEEEYLLRNIHSIENDGSLVFDTKERLKVARRRYVTFGSLCFGVVMSKQVTA